METKKLPKLRKINVNRPKKKKILLLSDDIVLTSGISTMSRELIMGTLHQYDWAQLSAALHHPDHGKVIDMSAEMERELNLENLYLVRYCTTGYGNPQQLREILQNESPDAIMIFTDPRFWGWFFVLEHEIHTIWKIPILYLNIWDSPPFPHWNFSAYRSCDLLMNISKQTHALVQGVLGEKNFQLHESQI